MKKPFYIGKDSNTLSPRRVAALTAKMAFLNEFFSTLPDCVYLRLHKHVYEPEKAYKNLTDIIRKQNTSRKKEPVSGFRLVNLQRRMEGWMMTANVSVSGRYYAANLFDKFNQTFIRPYEGKFFVSFITPRNPKHTYQKWHQLFYERSHLLTSQCKIDMIEPYYWRVEADNVPYVITAFIHILGAHIGTIISRRGVSSLELGVTPNIEPDDYFTSDRDRLSCRIKFFQPFGGFYNMLKNAQTSNIL